MPLCQINAKDDQLAAPRQALRDLRAAFAGLPKSAPVIVLIHGYKFSPARADASPHTHILSSQPSRTCWKAVSWPRRLGVGGEAQDEPLCIALGWEARGSFWSAYCNAAQAGRALARLITLIRRLRPGQPVDVLAHSLGGRVALSALPHLSPNAMGRAVLMAPAETQTRAARWMDCPAGCSVEVLHIASRENNAYDSMLEWLVAPHRWGDRALGLGRGLRQGLSNWIDIRLDDPATLAALTALGYPIAKPDRRICHWSVYLRPGVFQLYRGVLNDRLPLGLLRTELPAQATRPWFRRASLSRLPLSFAFKTAS